MTRTLKMLGLAGVAVVTLTGCGSNAHQSGPDPAPGSFTSPPGLHGFNMPDGFRNIIAFCDGPNMVYETSRGGTGSAAEGTSSTLYAVPGDPRCAR